MDNGSQDLPPSQCQVAADQEAGIRSDSASLKPFPHCRTSSHDESFSGLTIRTLRPDDMDELRQLDRSLFPVTYSDSFYDNLLANPNLSRVATNAGCVGDLVSYETIELLS